MSILKRLLGSEDPVTPESEVEAVRRIARELEAMEPERARYVAAFAYLLSRVANADLSVSEEETLKMERIVQALGHMSPDQAALVVEIAKAQNRLFGGTENFLVTREMREVATREQCLELLDCLLVAGAFAILPVAQQHRGLVAEGHDIYHVAGLELGGQGPEAGLGDFHQAGRTLILGLGLGGIIHRARGVDH